jgi:hypothetical protein
LFDTDTVQLDISITLIINLIEILMWSLFFKLRMTMKKNLVSGLKFRTIFVLAILGVVNLTPRPVIAGQRTIPMVSQYLKNSQLAQILTVPIISEQKTYVLDATTGLYSAVITYSSDDKKTYITTPMPMVNENSEIMVEKFDPGLIDSPICQDISGELLFLSPIELFANIQVC